MGVRLLSGKTVEGSLSASGTINAGDGIIGPVTIPGPSGDATFLSWAWSQTGGPSVVSLEESIDGGTTWGAFLKSDGSVNGATLYRRGKIVASSGFSYRLKIHAADFVIGTSLNGQFA